MRYRTLAAVTALAIGLCACNQGNADNVMAPSSNALEPAEINAVLGPETGASGDNSAEPSNDLNAVEETNAAGAEATTANETNTSGE